jgi:asparagine synthase (glutamine-hydrolysing)
MSALFSAYAGPAAGGGARSWETAISEHARWLGWTAHVDHHVSPTPSGVVRAVARLAPTAVPEGVRAFRSSTNAVHVETDEDGLTVRIPLASPQPCYLVNAFGGQVLTDDLRFCATLTGAALDPVGVYALLLFGQAPPPFTCFRGVQRLVGGHRYRLDGHVGGGVITATREFVSDPAPTTDEDLALGRVSTVLDGLICATPKHALLFFSGGVDSALLAARAAALGRTDIQLVNYAFGPHDPEAAHALRVAAHLRLACERITHEPQDSIQVIDRLARDYAFPFGDLSTLPTNRLVHAALGNGSGHSTSVLEGTGADGAFGLSATYSRWRTVFSMPAPLRLVGSAAYDWLRLWRFNFYLERALRFVRKSTRLGIEPAVLAQNSLDGIAFSVPRGVVVRGPDPQSMTPEERLSQLDLAWVCAGRMAPKTFDPLRAAGVDPIYPYLEPDLLRVSSSVSWSVKSAGGEEKALLKTLLARQLPAALIYRRKSGFTPPYRTTLATPQLQAFLHDVVLAPHNPLLEWCDVPTVTDLVTLAGGGADLSAGAVDFLWTLAFTSGWLRQLPRALRLEHRSVA